MKCRKPFGSIFLEVVDVDQPVNDPAIFGSVRMNEQLFHIPNILTNTQATIGL